MENVGKIVEHCNYFNRLLQCLHSLRRIEEAKFYHKRFLADVRATLGSECPETVGLENFGNQLQQSAGNNRLYEFINLS